MKAFHKPSETHGPKCYTAVPHAHVRQRGLETRLEVMHMMLRWLWRVEGLDICLLNKIFRRVLAVWRSS